MIRIPIITTLFKAQRGNLLSFKYELIEWIDKSILRFLSFSLYIFAIRKNPNSPAVDFQRLKSQPFEYYCILDFEGNQTSSHSPIRLY